MGAIPNFGLTLPSLLALGLVTLASGDNTVVETLVQYTTVLDIPGSSAATAAVTATSTGAPSYQTASLFRAQILNSTNFYRTQHNASALVWNSTLASFAHTVAEPCEFKHSGGPYGENLAAGYANATASIEAWGNEDVHYDFDSPSFTEQTGHFTQLVWKDTTSVGCAAEQCDGRGDTPGWFVVCEYWPPGNVLTEFAKEVQAAISGTGSRRMGPVPVWLWSASGLGAVAVGFGML